MSSSGSKYAINEHENLDKHGPYEIMPSTFQLNCKFGVSEQNPCWVVVLTSVSGTNYAHNEYSDLCEYGTCNTIQDSAILYQVGWIYLITCLSYCVNKLIW